MRAHLQTISGETTRQPANPSYPCCGIPFLSSRQSGDLQSSGMGALPCIPVSPSPVFEGLPPTIVHRPQSQNTALIANCLADPDKALTQAVLKPLTDLKLAGKISVEPCIILIDGMCEAHSHRPDYRDNIPSFVGKHLIRFPSWLKIVCTVRSNARDATRGLPFQTVSLDNSDVDERLNKDMCDYVTLRIQKSSLLRKNIMLSMNRNTEENKHNKFQNYLVQCAKGNFLYVKLTMDLIERGHLVLKSSSYKVLPQNLSEVFLLEFNLRFPTSQSFASISNILCICLATTRPLTLEELYLTVNALNVSSFITWNEFLSLYRPLVRYLVKRKDDTLMFYHPLFREWLVRRADTDSKKFLCDLRIGHSAIAISIARMEQLVECDKFKPAQ